ncbi:MAG: DUF5939 domain-containing protein, partial [Aureliella sp.]
QLLHGQAADMQAHPKLPERHVANKVWEKTMSWELDSTPAQLWPLVSNTERLNEAVGLPAVDYRTERDPILGARKFGSFTHLGVKVSWEEHPFEWIEGRRMGVVREFETGPFKWFMSVVTLESGANGRTKLSHQMRIEPRNVLGGVLTRFEVGWKAFRNLDKVYQRMDRSIQGRLLANQGSDPFAKSKPMSGHQSARLKQRIERICEGGVTPAVADKLQMAVQEWSAQELASLRPLAMAARLGVNGAEMVDACLVAADRGIFNLRWDILCPTCRVSAASNSELSQIASHTHCEACDIDFKSNLANAIELVFQAHPEIREVNSGTYCIGGPEHSPHVVTQVRLDAKECLDLTLDLTPGDYLLRGPRLSRTQSICVQSTAAPSSIDFTLSTLGVGNHTPKLRSGRQSLKLHNDLSTLHVLRLERMIPRADVVTAAVASANPLFRKLFPNQQFSGDNPIATETMTFLATSINNINAIYSSLNDADAYALVQKHHAALATCIGAAGGTVVKTVGEDMLAAFNARENAVLAAQHIREALTGRTLDVSSGISVEVGIGVHCGPTLVATQNNQLDYFGGTVRTVTSLPKIAGSDTLITESVYADELVAERLSSLGNSVSDDVKLIELPDSAQLRVKLIRTVEVYL